MKTATAKRNVANAKTSTPIESRCGAQYSLGAKSHSAAGNFQSLKAHKIALKPERRSGTLVSKPQTPKHVAAVASSCHKSYLSCSSLS